MRPGKRQKTSSDQSLTGIGSGYAGFGELTAFSVSESLGIGARLLPGNNKLALNGNGVNQIVD